MPSSRRVFQHALTYGMAIFLVFSLSMASGANSKAFGASLSSSLIKKAAASTTAVTTYKNNNAHTGSQNAETILSSSNVKQSTFGKRVAYRTDGQMYVRPLYLSNVAINGASHNVVYVATEHDSIYAFDADLTSATDPLWQASFIAPPAIVSPSNIDVGCNDTVPENGITSTPVLDPGTGTLYVVAMTKENGALLYRLHALDITTGKEKPGSPTLIQGTVAGTGADSVKGHIAFRAQKERQRSALVLANGAIYIAWSSFCDDDPYHGWIMSYSYSQSGFRQVNVYNDTANAAQGGIWGSGGAISVDSNGSIYYVSGNGGFDANKGGVDYGDSFVKLNAQLKVQDYFTPFNQQCLSVKDMDLGSGGLLLVPGMNRMISAGKEGRIYVVNTANMGHYTTIANPCGKQTVDRIVQELPPGAIGGLFSTSAYWRSASGQQFVYFAGVQDSVKAFPLNSIGRLAASPSSHTPEIFGFTGGNPIVSSNNGAAGTGILWTLDPKSVLRAFDATNLNRELYNSTQNASRDRLESYVKFGVPTVADGKVFVGTGSRLDIFGLLP